MMEMDHDELAGLIDHTNLYPDATTADIEQLCREADAYGFPAVCLYPADIPTAAAYRQEHDADYEICTVIGFPHGRDTATAKADNAEEAVSLGADEIDMVINRGHIKDGAYDAAVNEVKTVREAVPDTTLKVILENCDLNNEEKVVAYQAAIDGGADFLKTSTGFGEHGAQADDVALMADTIRNAAPDRIIGVKAAGGIRTAEDVAQMVAATGFDPDPRYIRIGASAGVNIIESLEDT